jgi:nitrogen fixation protein FixH
MIINMCLCYLYSQKFNKIAEEGWQRLPSKWFQELLIDAFTLNYRILEQLEVGVDGDCG